VPTYQYACTACDERLEAVQKFTDDPLTVCPACQGRLRKLFSAVGVVFKGSGFYRTDSRASAGSNGKRSSGSDESGGSERESAGKQSGSSEGSGGGDSSKAGATTHESGGGSTDGPKTGSKGGSAKNGSSKASRADSAA
jgi:putative FmdB family regulatory protein